MIKLGLSQRDFPPTWKPHKWLSARHIGFLPERAKKVPTDFKIPCGLQSCFWDQGTLFLVLPTTDTPTQLWAGSQPRVTYPTHSPSVKCPGLLRGLWFLPQTCQSFSIISLQNCHLTGDISASLDRQYPCCFRRGEGWISHCPRS